MTKDFKATVAQCLVVCGTVYGKESTKDQVEVYATLLDEYTADEVSAAFSAHTKDPERGQYFPKPADLIYQIRRNKPNAHEQAMLAWTEVPKLLRNSREAKSCDPITERVAQDLGGWTALGIKTAAELVWVAKEFNERYATYLEKGLDVTEKLAGERGLKLVGRDV